MTLTREFPSVSLWSHLTSCPGLWARLCATLSGAAAGMTQRRVVSQAEACVAVMLAVGGTSSGLSARTTTCGTCSLHGSLGVVTAHRGLGLQLPGGNCVAFYDPAQESRHNTASCSWL